MVSQQMGGGQGGCHDDKTQDGRQKPALVVLPQNLEQLMER